MSFWKDFKSFAMKGNVMDLAVAVVIGAAFNKIVSSFVNDLLMPLLSILLGRVNFANLSATLPVKGEGGVPIVLHYGNFIQSAVDFLIIALAIFLVIKLMGKLERKKEEAPAAPPAPTTEEKLLTEIRDILKKEEK